MTTFAVAVELQEPSTDSCVAVALSVSQRPSVLLKLFVFNNSSMLHC